MNLSGKLGYAALCLFLKPLSLLPLSWHRRLGNFIGWLVGDVIRYRENVVMVNLSRSFPDRKYGEIKDIRKRFYRHFGKIVAEAVWFGSCGNIRRLRKSHIAEFTNPELVNDLYRKGKTIFVLGSHCGNWEILGGYMSYAVKEPFEFDEKDVCVVYKMLTSPAWEEYMSRNRLSPIVDKKNYDGLVESFSIMRYAYNHRNEFKLYNFITDQFPYSEPSRIKVSDFMHQSTFAMNGAVALAKMFGTAVVYQSYRVKEDGNYEMTYRTICEDASEYELTDLLDKYFALIQEDLEKQPWNYLWTHKRWK